MSILMRFGKGLYKLNQELKARVNTLKEELYEAKSQIEKKNREIKRKEKIIEDCYKEIHNPSSSLAKRFDKAKESTLLSLCKKQYNSLKKGGIIFPPLTYKLETFSKYITDEEVQCAQIKANAINKIKKDNEKSIKESLNNVNNFANPFSGSGELNEKAKINNNTYQITHNEDRLDRVELIIK